MIPFRISHLDSAEKVARYGNAGILAGIRARPAPGVAGRCRLEGGVPLLR